jgi:hypothetical protein
VDQYHSKSGQPGTIKLPQDIQLPKKEEKVPEAQTSFGKLGEIEFEDSTYYESDAAKRARRGEEKEEPERSGRGPPYKRVRKEKDEVMDIDDEAERIMEIARQNHQESEPEYSTMEDPAKKVQFKDSEEVIKPTKEKVPRKTMLERPLDKKFPDTEEKVVNRMLMDGKIELSNGEVFAISHGAIEVIKKRTNPRVAICRLGSEFGHHDVDSSFLLVYELCFFWIRLMIVGKT